MAIQYFTAFIWWSNFNAKASLVIFFQVKGSSLEKLIAVKKLFNSFSKWKSVGGHPYYFHFLLSLLNIACVEKY